MEMFLAGLWHWGISGVQFGVVRLGVYEQSCSTIQNPSHRSACLKFLLLFLLFAVRVLLSCVCVCVHLFFSESCGFRCVLGVGGGGNDARLAYIFQSSDLFALFVVLPAVDGEASLHAAACAGRNLRRLRLHSH